MPNKLRRALNFQYRSRANLYPLSVSTNLFLSIFPRDRRLHRALRKPTSCIAPVCCPQDVHSRRRDGISQLSLCGRLFQFSMISPHDDLPRAKNIYTQTPTHWTPTAGAATTQSRGCRCCAEPVGYKYTAQMPSILQPILRRLRTDCTATEFGRPTSYKTVSIISIHGFIIFFCHCVSTSFITNKTSACRDVKTLRAVRARNVEHIFTRHYLIHALDI